MLALGNFLLALGMVGLSLLRYKLWHFSMFSLHIIGYAISDTALASLISRYVRTYVHCSLTHSTQPTHLYPIQPLPTHNYY